MPHSPSHEVIMKTQFLSFLLTLFLSSLAFGQDVSQSETSYSGAKILEGDIDVFFNESVPIGNPDAELEPYAFFEGNTLYAGNSDEFGNTVDAIIEFFWFESSIDRGSDFYVAVIKTRVTPGDDCHWAPFSWADGVKCRLWTDQWQDWGEHPVMSVEAHTNIELEQGAFRWDWSIPFETYGIDAYGQVTLKNQYGLGVNTEGAAVAHGEYQVDEQGNVELEGDVQVKGFANEEYSVKTQYNITLWEWEIFVDGRADLMAWDMYLNLSARDEQSAYHEYFLSIQVAEGEMFTLDQINILGNFDKGWYNPIHHEIGVSIGPIMINQPFYEIIVPDEPEPQPEPEPTPEEPEKEVYDYFADLFPETEHEPTGENPPRQMEPVEETVAVEENPSDPHAGYRNVDWDYFKPDVSITSEPEASQPEVVYVTESGCNVGGSSPSLFMFLFVALPLLLRNRYDI